MKKKQMRDQFNDRMKYWQRQFNLMDYELAPVTHAEIEDEPAQTIVSDVIWHHCNRWARVRINKEWKDTKREINRVAFHEMLELRLGKLRDMAGAKYSFDEVDEQIHIVIRVLENLILK